LIVGFSSRAIARSAFSSSWIGRHRGRCRQRHQLGPARWDPDSAEELELGFVLGLLRAQQRHVGLALGTSAWRTSSMVAWPTV
jgi:hypothetical protein